MRKTKGIRIDAMCRILRVGTSTKFPIPWETPYLVLEIEGIREPVKWHSEACEEWYPNFPTGSMWIRGFLYEDGNIKRVSKFEEF